MNNNPWEPSNDAQKEWMGKWKREQEVCKACEEKRKCKCDALDRMNKNICQLKK